jgi:hypothetical protein
MCGRKSDSASKLLMVMARANYRCNAETNSTISMFIKNKNKMNETNNCTFRATLLL